MAIHPRHQIDIAFQDLLFGFASFCTPLSRSKLESDIAAVWPSHHVRASYTIRTALDSLLRSLALPRQSEVLMSGVNILDMLKVVEAHDLKVVGVDIDVDDVSVSSASLEQHITEKTKVLIVAQLFGTINDLEAISKVCQKHNILLIEDCAQAYCGSSYTGSPFADISLFSFGSIKSRTALGGALIVAKQEEYIRVIEQVESAYPVQSELFFLKRLFKYTGIKVLSIPAVYGTFIKGLQIFKFDAETAVNRLSKSFPQGDVWQFICFQPPTRMLLMLKRRLASGDDYFEKRRRVAEEFLGQLGDSVVVVGRKAKRNSYWIVPVVAKDPVRLQALLLQNGFDSTQGRQSQIAIDELENATIIADSVVYLPSITNMSKRSRSRLAKLVSQV